MPPPAKSLRISRINLLTPATQGSAHAQLKTPIGVVRRRQGLSLPETAMPTGKRPVADTIRADELARVGKMTSLTQILSLLGAPTSYRTYSLGISALAKAIRRLSSQVGGSVPQRFGCATAEELATRLLFLFRKKGLEKKALEIAAQRRAGSARKPQGRIWSNGGALWEEIVRMDEALSRILRQLANEEVAKLKASSRATALRRGRLGKFVQSEVVFSPKVEISPLMRSVEVATKLKGGEKLYDSIDDIHFVVINDNGKQYLVLVVRAQIKREAAAQKLGKQTDYDLSRFTSDDLDAVVLKDHVDANNEPLRFARDQILFVQKSASRAVGIVQDSTVPGAGQIRQDTFVTPKGVPVDRLSVGVDVRLHNELIELVLTTGRVDR